MKEICGEFSQEFNLIYKKIFKFGMVKPTSNLRQQLDLNPTSSSK